MDNSDSENDNNAISNEFPSDNYLLAIGRLTVIFSRFEENVATLVALSFGCEPEVIANIAYFLNIGNRCQILRGILNYRLGVVEESDQETKSQQDVIITNLDQIFAKVTKA
jgi:hypothetical protein